MNVTAREITAMFIQLLESQKTETFERDNKLQGFKKETSIDVKSILKEGKSSCVCRITGAK